MTTAAILEMNIPFMVLFLALWIGIPMWMIHKHPDRHPRENRTVPAYLLQRRATGLPPQRRVPARVAAQRRERELVRAGRS
jgi:hypothetical protein